QVQHGVRYRVKLPLHSPVGFDSISLLSLSPHSYDVVRSELSELDLLTQDALYALYGYRPPPREGGRPPPPSARRRAAFPNRLGLRLIDPGRRRGLEITGRRAGLSPWQLHNPPLVRNSSWKIGFKLCNVSGEDCFYNWHSSGVDAVREWYTFHYVNVMAQVPDALGTRQGDQIGDFVYDCKFNGLSCGKSNYTRFHHPIYGNCYTFNGINSSYQWQTTKTGKDHGLSLLLKTEQNDYIPLLSTDAGARVMIHQRNKSPFMEDGGFDIRPGVETSISMRKEEVRFLGGDYSDCTHDGSEIRVHNLYRSDYTQQACVRSCFQTTMVSRCGCAYYFYPLPPGAEYCNYNKHTAWGHCYYRLSKEFSADVLGCFKTCRKPCQQTEYQMIAGYASWPSKNAESWIYPLLQMEKQFSTSHRKEIAKLNLFFRELNYKTMSETPALPMVVMLSNLGSQWSLWFGSSVLSVVEILELLLDLGALCVVLAAGAPPPTP
ncbi:LOW QUALITY PROTEIN: epithelial sodium channel subunit alpha-like, partial [Mustelus asterias]